MREENLNGDLFTSDLHHESRPLIVGSGKLARHLQAYFKYLNLDFDTWNETRNLNSNFYQKLSESTLAILAISDQALVSVSEEIRKHAENSPLLCHCSGASTVAGVYSFHPLMTFGPELYEKEQYQKIPFTLIEEEWKDSPSAFQNFLKNLPNELHFIPAKKRSLYHAYAVMVSNLPQILWSETLNAAKRDLELPAKTFFPLMQQASQNFFQFQDQALTGPLVRQDQVTLEKHEQALETNPGLKELYQSFVKIYSKKNGPIPGEAK